MLHFLDVTYLADNTVQEDLAKLCQAVKTNPVMPAGICVYPQVLAFVKQQLGDIAIKYVSVINFPSGQAPLTKVKAQMEEAMMLGACELDVVIPYITFLDNHDASCIANFLSRCRQYAHSAKLKVILESGELKKPEHIYQLSLIACEAGADFIKTSTGKVQQGASLAATAIIIKAISEHYQKTKQRVGLKVSGGIRTFIDAQQYMMQVKESLGNEWLTPDLFRIGASQLFWELSQIP